MKNTKRKYGKYLTNAGVVIVFIAFALAAVLKYRFSVPPAVNMTVAVPIMTVGVPTLVFGVIVRRREKKEDREVGVKEVLRSIAPWLWAAMCSFIMIQCFLAVVNSEAELLKSVFFGGAIICFLAAVILGVVHSVNLSIAQKQASLSARKNYVAQPSTAVCRICRKTFMRGDLFSDGSGGLVCRVCGARVVIEKEKEKARRKKQEEDLQTVCAGCGKHFPKSSMHSLPDGFLCDECFAEKYKAEY